jgi:peptidoglycan/xylan/chitin deacetylase (PgdA/CDA1 family)/glycosyltransferase involved in cell wall biosynthesis
VILPVRNCHDYIQDALDSILRQSYSDFEVLIADDGSDDFDYTTLAHQDPRIRVFRLDGRGVSCARNEAIRKARGELIAFLDADDVWCPGKLTAQVRYLTEHPDVGIVFGSYLKWSASEAGIFPASSSLTADCSELQAIDATRSGWIYTRLLLGQLVGMNTAVARITICRELGGFDESLRVGEDYDFWLRASQSTEMHCLAGVVALYRIHTKSAMHRIDAENLLARVLVSAHERWGGVNPDGSRISEIQFRRRVAMTDFEHGYRHYWHGDPAIARQSFAAALRGGARRFRSAVYLGLASVKAATHRQGHVAPGGPTVDALAPLASTPNGSSTARVASGAPLWARCASRIVHLPWLGEYSRKLTIFTFHKVPRELDEHAEDEIILADFARLLGILRENFNVLPLPEAIDRLACGALPEFSAALTFDDGYPTWMTGVVPLLEAHAFPATFFITTGQLDGEPLWFERLNRVLYQVGPRPEPLTRLLKNVGLGPELDQAVQVIKHVKYLSTARRKAFIAECEAACGVDTTYPLLSAEDVRLLHAKGFSIGAHTVNHPILAVCSDVEARDEITRSRETLQSIIGEPVRLFAYPNGKPGIDISPAHVRYVRDAGFRAAVTTASGAASRSTSVFQLPRFSPWGRTSRRFLLQYLLTLNRAFPSINDAKTSATAK